MVHAKQQRTAHGEQKQPGPGPYSDEERCEPPPTLPETLSRAAHFSSADPAASSTTIVIFILPWPAPQKWSQMAR
jgi:hypothetical protein